MAEIRKAKKSDLERVMYVCRMTAGNLSIRDEAIGKINGLTYAAYYIEHEADNCFVLCDGEVVVGYIICSTDEKNFRKAFYKDYIKKIAEINKSEARKVLFIPIPYMLLKGFFPSHLHINLLPDYQGKGYGTQMINTLLSELKKKGIKSVMLLADAENTGAIKFYENNDFKKFVTAFGGVGMYKKLR
ncbi:MAG: GNAT family N-acetyltransferase [Clostridia bacterium]|nr:GNAT family N-acetyltransferase [Clostridia bacterium]